MLKLILPTTEIYRAHRHYEPILCFYEDGVRGLIRDTVLLCNPTPTLKQDEDERSDDLRALLDKVLGEYESSVDRAMLENMFRRQDYASWLVEMCVCSIEEQVNRLMREFMQVFLRDDAFELCKSRCSWLGADLLVRVEIYR